MNDNNYKLICTLDNKALLALVNNAKNRICIVLPGIFDELAEALAVCKKKGVATVQVLTDISEDNIRNGFGTITAIEKLQEAPVEIFECSDNLVSFIVCDEVGYWLFPQSRIFRFEQAGTNAAVLDPIAQIRLIHHFFPSSGKTGDTDCKEELHRALAEVQESASEVEQELNELPALDQPIYLLDTEELKNTKIKLEQNPPLHPDLRRKINTYIAKVQFVELSFDGANIHTIKITIPPAALPFKDKRIKKLLKTKMLLFEDLKDKDAFKDFMGLKDTVDKIRKKYLTSITSREKSILQLENKQSFIDEVKNIQVKVTEIKKHFPDELLMSLMLDSKDRLKKELVEFFMSNPPDTVMDFTNEHLQERAIDNIAVSIIEKIKYPELDDLLKKTSIKVHFFDLTFEDFQDADFIKELQEKSVMTDNDISSIVKIKQAFSTKSEDSGLFVDV